MLRATAAASERPHRPLTVTWVPGDLARVREWKRSALQPDYAELRGLNARTPDLVEFGLGRAALAIARRAVVEVMVAQRSASDLGAARTAKDAFR